MPAFSPRVISRRFALALSLCLAATAVARAQATIADCEKIQAADAYNQCLAKFGPEQKSQNLAPERPGDIKNNAEEAAAGASRPGPAPRAGARVRNAHRYGAARRFTGGRKRLVFTVRRRR